MISMYKTIKMYEQTINVNLFDNALYLQGNDLQLHIVNFEDFFNNYVINKYIARYTIF